MPKLIEFYRSQIRDKHIILIEKLDQAHFLKSLINNQSPTLNSDLSSIDKCVPEIFLNPIFQL